MKKDLLAVLNYCKEPCDVIGDPKKPLSLCECWVSHKEAEQEKIDLNGWIPTKRELPDVGDEYNVVWNVDDEGEPVVTTMFFDAVEKHWVDEVSNSVYKNNSVTHWRPLPSIPKGL